MRPWYSLIDLEDRLSRLSPEDQLTARSAWFWFKLHAALIPALTLLLLLLGDTGVVTSLTLPVFFYLMKRWHPPLTDQQAAERVRVHVPIMGQTVVVHALLISVLRLIPGFDLPFTAALVFTNAQMTVDMLYVVQHYLKKQPPRARKRLRESVRLGSVTLAPTPRLTP